MCGSLFFFEFYAGTPFQWDSSKWAGFSEGNIKPWLPVHRNYVELNLALQSKFKRSTFKLYKQLVKLRKNQSFIYGSYKSKVVNDNVLAYVRFVYRRKHYSLIESHKLLKSLFLSY